MAKDSQLTTLAVRAEVAQPRGGASMKVTPLLLDQRGISCLLNHDMPEGIGALRSDLLSQNSSRL